jgi:dienelactone hydrolase
MRSGTSRFVLSVAFACLLQLSLALAAALFSSARASFSAAAILPPISPAEISRRVAELTPVPWDQAAIVKTKHKSGACVTSSVILNVGDPLNGSKRKITVQELRPAGSGPTGVMLIIPTIEGVGILENHIAARFCSEGIASIITDLRDNSQPPQMPAWGFEDFTDRNEILGIRTVISYVSQSPHYDPKKVGMFGLSLGGIVTSMVAGLEANRLSALVIAVGGGNLPFTLARSENDKISLLRKRRMDFLGLQTQDQYESELARSIRYDPLYFAGQASPQNILMAISTADTRVPYFVQREQFDAFGKPNYILFSSDHIETLIQLTFFYLTPVVDFVKSRFSPGGPPIPVPLFVPSPMPPLAQAPQ